MTSQPTPTPEEWVVKERKIEENRPPRARLVQLEWPPYYAIRLQSTEGGFEIRVRGGKAGKILHDMNNLDRHFESFGFSVSWLERRSTVSRACFMCVSKSHRNCFRHRAHVVRGLFVARCAHVTLGVVIEKGRGRRTRGTRVRGGIENLGTFGFKRGCTSRF